MTPSPRRFLRLPEVKLVTGYGRTAIYDKIKAGEFPAPFQLSATGRAVAWDSIAVAQWIESRIDAGRSAK